MSLETLIQKKADKASGGSVSGLESILAGAFSTLRAVSGSDDAFQGKLEQILETAVNQQGEEHREYYQELIGRVTKAD